LNTTSARRTQVNVVSSSSGISVDFKEVDNP
jgi:hypothetical protein